MRRLLILALLVPSLAHGEGDKKTKPKPIDLKPVAGKLVAYRDDLGNYYVTPASDSSLSDSGQWVFFGDGKAMYQQRIAGSSVKSNTYEWYLWAPRAKHLDVATLRIMPGEMTMQCAPEDPRKLTQLKADEAATLFAKTTFYAPLWQRTPHFLARDDDGIYYYVDALREEYGGNGYRIFVGMKGSMKELAMTNMASDSAGEIYATKGGQLKIIANADGKAYWIKGGKKTELTTLEPAANRYLIYRELGIYGPLGAVCDDL